MKHVLTYGKTLLVDGPASVHIVSGRIEILAAPFKSGEKIVIREGKRVPFEAKKRATLQLMLGEGAASEEIEGSTIPPSWKETANEVLSHEKPVTVMVVGEVDSGKTSFCTYLVNRAVRSKFKVAIIDGDIGQSDIGAPSTIGYARLTKPVKDLFDLELEDACFIGQTSPSGAIDKVIKGLVTLKNKAAKNINFLVINTDGWTQGEDAVKYKTQLTESVAPDIVVAVQQEKELKPLLDKVKGVKVLIASSPKAIKKRDREKRKLLRELSYKKHLKEAKVQTFPLSWIKIEGLTLGSAVPLREERIREITELLRMRPLYCEESPELLLMVLKRNQWLPEEDIQKIESTLKKRLKIMQEGEEEGLLVSLQNAQGRFLGIGILEGINYRKRTMRIYTPVKKSVSTICIGKIRLDRNCREISVSPMLYQVSQQKTP